MKFTSNSRRRALVYEKELIQYWKENQTFEKSVAARPISESYVFYDGPPFITGVPHHGTLLSSVVKDAVPRYHTMKGRRVERVWGWDCHGLPAEVFTEKKLGISDRRDIGTKISLEEYITTARDNMVQTSSLWNDTIDRIGRWVDMDNAYKTMDKEYMESVWWAFKTLYDKGKIYEGERVLMYCTRDATPLSKAEVTMDAGAYQDVTDPSVYVAFMLTKESTERLGLDRSVALLAWTTTPWTLPANTALALSAETVYAEVVVDGRHLILADELRDTVLRDEKHQPIPHTVEQTFTGKELVGLHYEPLFGSRGEKAHRIWDADYVTTESGTGIVHIAPAYGEEDFALAQAEGIPVVHVIDESGLYTETQWKGENVWEINKTIAKTLHEQGIVWKIDYIRHSYPHCHRCGTKLMYRAHPSWFFNVQDQKDAMLEKNDQQIEWFPEHLKHGRFEKNIEQAPDWNLSRDRFWATAMPVWEGVDADGNKRQIVVGSYAELKELSGVELEDYHRPWVDAIEFDVDGVHYTRIDKVLDGWFESGSMPFAQFHYPFENKEKFEANFPGDFIAEYIGQVRAWFYYMQVISVGLFGESPFKHVITTGVVAGNDGRKMSKSYGNYTDPNELMDTYSADSLRYLLLSSPLLSGEDFSLQDKDVGDVARKLSMVWNMYDFFTMYAEVDGWQSPDELADPSSEVKNPLDQWILSRLHQLTEEVATHMDSYDIPSAMKPILPFIDDASNWYVRRSRRRFWKSEDDADKNDAYRTLHFVLVRLAEVMAPFTPFLSEELYRQLTGGESVHLRDWPVAGIVNQLVLSDMARTREIIEEGLGLRMRRSDTEQQIKIRQPLPALAYGGARLDAFYETIIAEEVNVKQVVHRESLGNTELDKTITPELHREGMSREVIRHVQAARKNAGLNVDDRIVISLSSDDDTLTAALREHADTIAEETLATYGPADDGYRTEGKIEGSVLQVALKVAAQS